MAGAGRGTRTMTVPSAKETLEYLYALQSGGIKPGLERIRALLGALGGPQNKIPSIHIAGTNGKGSTAAMIEAALIEAGYRTGLYTSPHLVRFNERIRINGRPVSDAVVVRSAERVRSALATLSGEMAKPSFFEFTTAMAFACFEDKGVDIAILETGMGGRWDATNTVVPLVSIITNIGKEHTQYLGTTLAHIAAEKAGIVKPGVPVLTAEDKPAALRVIRETARKANSPLFSLGRDFTLAPADNGKLTYKGLNSDIGGIKLALTGAFQRKNGALAMAALELIGERGFTVGAKAAREGLKKTDWPGRVETLSKRPLVVLDSAHNPAGAVVLKEALSGFRFKRLILVAGCMADKDIRGILSPLASVASSVILTRPKTDRAAATPILRGALKGYTGPVSEIEPVGRACAVALREAGQEDAVCVTGSIFTVGEAKRYLAKRLKKPCNRTKLKQPE